MFEDPRDLLMDQTGAAVLLAGVDCGWVIDVKTPLPWGLAEPLNEGRDHGLRDGFYGGPFKGEGVRKELPTEEEWVLGQKRDIDPRKLYHPWGKLGTLAARREGGDLLSDEALLSLSGNADMSFGHRYGHT